MKKRISPKIKLDQATPEEMKVLYPRLKQLMEDHNQQKKPVLETIVGKPFWVYPSVFNPTKGRASTILLGHLKFPKETTILDVGTGCGLYGIISLYQGAKQVVATDINPRAIACARRNVKLHKMADRMQVRKGNVFSAIKENEKFDVIIANPPFFRAPQVKPLDYIKRCFLDQKAHFLYEFLHSARNHLTEKGKILLVYGKSGYIEELLNLIAGYHYKYTILETKLRQPDIYYILEITSLDNKT